jgi:hypothetical protein
MLHSGKMTFQNTNNIYLSQLAMQNVAKKHVVFVRL